MRRIIVKEINKKYNVISCLTDSFPSLSSASIYKALRNKDIRVNGKKINENISLVNGDSLEVYITDEILYGLPKNIEYIFEDENILVANKPVGILSNREKDMDIEPTFYDLIKKEKAESNDDFNICHRLDRNTAGLIIFSKTKSAYEEIVNAFKNDYIKKEYIAFVHNSSFSKNHDILKGFIITDKKGGYSKITNEYTKNSKEVFTEYTVLKTNKVKNIVILNIQIHAGKTHQIRAHLSLIDHPIIGDSKYGLNEVNNKFRITKQMLFAYKLIFAFPKDSFLSYLNDVIISKYPDDKRIEWLGEI